MKTVVIVVVVLVVLLLLALLLVGQRKRAQVKRVQRREQAEQHRREAEKVRLEADRSAAEAQLQATTARQQQLEAEQQLRSAEERRREAAELQQKAERLDPEHGRRVAREDGADSRVAQDRVDGRAGPRERVEETVVHERVQDERHDGLREGDLGRQDGLDRQDALDRQDGLDRQGRVGLGDDGRREDGLGTGGHAERPVQHHDRADHGSTEVTGSDRDPR